MFIVESTQIARQQTKLWNKRLEQFGNIKDMLEGRTAVLISHRVGFGRMADRIIMLDEGEIVEMGSHDELMAQNGHYAHFFLEQAQWYSKESASVSETGVGS